MTERLEAWLAHRFGDADESNSSLGWGSGIIAVLLGVLAICSVLALHFPQYLTIPELRTRYPLDLVRLAIDVGILAGILLAGLSILLRRDKLLGICGLALCGLALALGAGGTPLGPWQGTSVYLGIDWFVLGVLSTVALFVPLERAFPHRREQGPFRKGWLTDTQYFFMSHALVQLMSVLVLLPVTGLGTLLAIEPVQLMVQKLPLAVQFLACVLIADLTQYWVLRAFHQVPVLWRFHKVLHSVKAMDWIAGSRLHLVDVIVTRGLVLLPLIFMGFEEVAIFAYLAFVSVHAVFIHANFGISLRGIERFLVTPRYHHWHHAREGAAVDTNFAVHLPWLDTVFGTRHFPSGTWPHEYGVQDGEAPDGYIRQLLWPFRKDGR